MACSCGTESGLVVRTMTRQEVDLAVAWAAAEGWNPGRHDAESFYQTDPTGFLIAEIDGNPVGCISCVTYGDAFAFIGFFIVKPEFRGRGYGMALWRAALDHAGSRIVGLDGVVAQQANYAKSGFVLKYSNIRYEALGRSFDGPLPHPLASIPFDELVEYDARCFPTPRRRFLESWCAMPESVGFAVRREGRLAGYGLIRPCGTGYKIGPLFADDADIAESLYRSLSEQAIGAPVYLDVPEVNSAAMALAEGHGMHEVFRTARMYLNGTPTMKIDRVFGVTTFELG